MVFTNALVSLILKILLWNIGSALQVLYNALYSWEFWDSDAFVHSADNSLGDGFIFCQFLVLPTLAKPFRLFCSFL